MPLGVDVNAPNSDGSTALHVAATVGSRGVVQFLTDHGADINAVDSLGNTPLNVSASGRNAVSVYRLKFPELARRELDDTLRCPRPRELGHSQLCL